MVAPTEIHKVRRAELGTSTARPMSMLVKAMIMTSVANAPLSARGRFPSSAGMAAPMRAKNRPIRTKPTASILSSAAGERWPRRQSSHMVASTAHEARWASSLGTRKMRGSKIPAKSSRQRTRAKNPKSRKGPARTAPCALRSLASPMRGTRESAIRKLTGGAFHTGASRCAAALDAPHVAQDLGGAPAAIDLDQASHPPPISLLPDLEPGPACAAQHEGPVQRRAARDAGAPQRPAAPLHHATSGAPNRPRRRCGRRPRRQQVTRCPRARESAAAMPARSVTALPQSRRSPPPLPPAGESTRGHVPREVHLRASACHCMLIPGAFRRRGRQVGLSAVERPSERRERSPMPASQPEATAARAPLTSACTRTVRWPAGPAPPRDRSRPGAIDRWRRTRRPHRGRAPSWGPTPRPRRRRGIAASRGDRRVTGRENERVAPISIRVSFPPRPFGPRRPVVPFPSLLCRFGRESRVHAREISPDWHRGYGDGRPGGAAQGQRTRRPRVGRRRDRASDNQIGCAGGDRLRRRQRSRLIVFPLLIRRPDSRRHDRKFLTARAPDRGDFLRRCDNAVEA